MSTLDAEKGYWQVEIDEDSKKYTAFSTEQGLFEFNRLAFGLRNGPATYQRLMQDVLAVISVWCIRMTS